jgi:erythronate-4-phosphate dehydrogenase
MALEHNFILKDKTIGIVGVGNVGAKVEKIARILGMNVLLNDPPRERKEGKGNFVELDTILYESDIITLHVPFNVVGKDSTYHFFNRKSFNKMKKGAWLFNTSRGEVAETAALKRALKSGKLGGAVLDVWENEPDIDLELMSEAYVATPHIAGYSTDGKANGTAMVVNSLSKFFDLPLKNWYPEDVPQPPDKEIIINCTGKSFEEILREAVFHTYNVADDDAKFRFSPSDFEKLRGDYPLRREFPSYKVILRGGCNDIMKDLDKMGFIVD